MAQPIRAIHAYRTILRTIRDVFNDDLRMQRAGNIQTRVMYEKFRNEQDPKKIEYLISEAEGVSDHLYRDIMKVQYDPIKGKHVGVVEKRHLKFEDGTHVYTRNHVRNRDPTKPPISHE